MRREVVAEPVVQDVVERRGRGGLEARIEAGVAASPFGVRHDRLGVGGVERSGGGGGQVGALAVGQVAASMRVAGAYSPGAPTVGSARGPAADAPPTATTDASSTRTVARVAVGRSSNRTHPPRSPTAPGADSVGADLVSGRLQGRGACGRHGGPTPLNPEAYERSPVNDTPHATEATRRSLEASAEALPFGDRQDFEDTERGFIARAEARQVLASDGRVVWDLDAYAFLEGDAPDTVNPSLWRQGQLLIRDGLFEVVPGIYQLRGFDLSVMSVIETDNGVIVIDPLISKETAAAAWALYREHRGDRPVVAMIYTHSHIDHFGGVKGVITDDDVASGRTQVIAPVGFMQHAVSRERLRRHGDGSARRVHVRRRAREGPGRSDRLRPRPDHVHGRADAHPAHGRHHPHGPGTHDRRGRASSSSSPRAPRLPRR